MVGAANSNLSYGDGTAYIFSISPGTLFADSEYLPTGDSTTLSWSYPGATSVFIDNGVGYVSAEDSVLVSPTETTTYTITAEGPWGVDTREIVIYVADPATVTLSSNESSIIEGNSIILSWHSTNSESVYIEPEIGSVEADGFLVLYPTDTTTYQVIAANLVSEVTASVTVEVIKRVTITSPADGETINKPDILVKGTLYNPDGEELGVKVNGITASVDVDQFVANHVPLEDGNNEIVVICTTASGVTATETISVYVDIADEDYIRITPDDESGVAPFETAFRIGSTFSITEEPFITYSGPGDIDIVKTGDEYKYTLNISLPGLYYINAEVENDGYTFTDAISILVMDEIVLNSLLKTKWNGMKTALSDGDINAGLEYIAENSKDTFEYNFNLMSSYLSEFSNGLGNITLGQINGAVADYEMIVTYEGETYNFLVRFVKDNDGIWRIRFF